MKTMTSLTQLIISGVVVCIAIIGPLLYRARELDVRHLEMSILIVIVIGNFVYFSHALGNNPNRRLLFGICWAGFFLYMMFFEYLLSPQLFLFVVSAMLTIINITIFVRKRCHQASDPQD
jgi:nitroreductase